MLRALLILLAFQAVPALAQEVGFGEATDKSAPVEVSADNLSVNQQSGQAVFTGNVVIGQGDLRVAADRVEVEYAGDDQSRIQSFRATGSVTLASGDDAAEAEEADYDVSSGVVILTGNVLLAQGNNVLSGDRMELDLETGTASVDGRVRTILYPEHR